ncbi:MAG TPA: Ku protein [Thermoleophilia bacterium]
MARALWKGAISFGLVTIPVSLYPAKDDQGNVTFHMLHKSDLSRVHNLWMDDENHEVPFDEVVKGYEYDKGQYVVIGEADLEAANVEATQSIDIMHFVDGEEIDIAYYDTPYYTEPAKVGRKAYALLRETLKRTGKVGVAKVVIRERQHLCAVIADGPALLAHTLRWPYQLRDASEFDLPGEDLGHLGVSPQELKMAEQLVEAMATDWKPEQYHDTYRDDLLKLIDEKVKSGKVSQVSEPAKREAGESNVVDIMSLLKRSMEQQKSTPSGDAAEKTAAPKSGGKRRGARRAS